MLLNKDKCGANISDENFRTWLTIILKEIAKNTRFYIRSRDRPQSISYFFYCEYYARSNI